MKSEHYFALGALLACLLASSAIHAEPFQEGSERTEPNRNDVPVFTLPSGVKVAPRTTKEEATEEVTAKSVGATIDNKATTRPPITLFGIAIVGLGALVWWRIRKNNARKKSTRWRPMEGELSSYER